MSLILPVVKALYLYQKMSDLSNFFLILVVLSVAIVSYHRVESLTVEGAAIIVETRSHSSQQKNAPLFLGTFW